MCSIKRRSFNYTGTKLVSFLGGKLKYSINFLYDCKSLEFKTLIISSQGKNQLVSIKSYLNIKLNIYINRVWTSAFVADQLALNTNNKV